MKDNKSIKIPTPAAIVLVILLAASSFYAGISWIKNKAPASSNITKTTPGGAVFTAQKADKPQLDFYVMAFCPFGNQIEETLRPVFDLIGEKAVIQPHYIFDKIANLEADCKTRSGDVTNCKLYVENKYFTTEAECKKVISKNYADCTNGNNYIKSSTGTFYSSLHGRVEANQNVRELCAWKLSDNKLTWWNFVDNVNKNCDSKNADTCWEDQAKKAGLDTAKITECFNKDGISLIEAEIALTEKNKISGSPTVLINDVNFPPETAYTQDGKGTLKIGKKEYSQADFRTPNVLKEAVCASFKKAPSECSKTIEATATQNAAASAGGCQ